MSSSVSGAFNDDKLALESTLSEVSSSVTSSRLELKATLSEVSSSVTSSRLELKASIGSVSSSVSGAFNDDKLALESTLSNVSSSVTSSRLEFKAAEATFSSSFTLVGAMTASLTEATASAESSLASIGVSTASIAATTASIEVDSGSLAAAIQLTSASLNVLNSDSNIIAEFGANTFVGLQSSEHVQISPSGLDLKDGSTVLGRFASTTTIGDTSTEHVSISGSGLELLDGSTQRFAINSSGVAIGDNFGVDASGNVTMAGTVTATAGDIAGFRLFDGRFTTPNSGVTMTSENGGFLGTGTNNAGATAAHLLTESTGIGLIGSGSGYVRLGQASSSVNASASFVEYNPKLDILKMEGDMLVSGSAISTGSFGVLSNYIIPHIIHGGTDYDSTSPEFLPIGGGSTRTDTSQTATEYNSFIAPFDGKLGTFSIRAEEAAGSAIVRIFTTPEGTESNDPSDLTTNLLTKYTFTISADDTVYSQDTAAVGATFSKGDVLQATIDGVANFNDMFFSWVLWMDPSTGRGSF